MYDENITSIGMTSDEVELFKEFLFYRLERCASVGEEITVRDLIDKLK